MSIPELSLQGQVVGHRSISASAGVYFSSDLNLRTQEGDRVKLSFDSERSFSETQSQTQYQDGAAVQEFSSVSQAAFQYSLAVEGELSEEELAAIRELTQAVVPIAQSFFTDGEFDIEKAREALAGNLGIIEEIELALEKTEVVTFSAKEFSRPVEGDESAVQAPQLPQAPDVPGEPPPPIQNLPELVFASIEAEFQAQAITSGTDESILRTLGDLLKFIREQLGPVLNPLSFRASGEPSPEDTGETQPTGNGESLPVDPAPDIIPDPSQLI